VPPDDVKGSLAQAFDRTDRILLRNPREWDSVEEMAARRNQGNPRLSGDWALHLARHGTKRGPRGGWRWKADPMFGLGVPSHFDVEMLEIEQRRVQCRVLVCTGDMEDTWRDLTPEQEAERVGWLRARHVVIEGTGHYVHLEDPEQTMAAIAPFLAEVGL
jgi:pimeloyl-ACP methyl ester carboxylesterase